MPCPSCVTASYLQTLQFQMSQDEDGVEVIHRQDSHPLVLEGGKQRTVFRLSIQMQRLEAVFNYETSDAPPLGSVSVQVPGQTPSLPCVIALHACLAVLGRQSPSGLHHLRHLCILRPCVFNSECKLSLA